jgi:hypothetical protein
VSKVSGKFVRAVRTEAGKGRERRGKAGKGRERPGRPGKAGKREVKSRVRPSIVKCSEVTMDGSRLGVSSP